MSKSRIPYLFIWIPFFAYFFFGTRWSPLVEKTVIAIWPFLPAGSSLMVIIALALLITLRLLFNTLRSSGFRPFFSEGKVLMAWALVALISLWGLHTIGQVNLLALSSQCSNCSTTIRTVFASQGWQDTKLNVHAGDEVTIEYRSGTWTSTRGIVESTDADGQPVNAPDWLYCSCGEPLPGDSTQALIGKIGSTQPFFVGDEKDFRATDSGNIFLRINDSDRGLSDNDGSLQIAITTPTHKTSPTKQTSPTKHKKAA